MENVAAETKLFAARFDADDLGHAIGLAHDLGKARPAFQRYLPRSAERRAWPGSENHKLTGASMALELHPASRTSFQVAFLVRMLFSCLVDADFLDTERFLDPDKAAWRRGYPTLADLRLRFEATLRERADKPETPVNRIRTQVLDACLRQAEERLGLFSLTVPTGGGKTLSSLAFASWPTTRARPWRASGSIRSATACASTSWAPTGSAGWSTSAPRPRSTRKGR